ncbi:MAG: sensor histidine kinase [Candidatus Thorarchaeota archaeon]|jgi:signal transduction histidine kinase
MGTNRRGSLADRVVYYSFIALGAVFVWFLVGLPVLQSVHADIAFQSFLAFSAIACIAVSLLAYKERPSPFLILFLSALFFSTNAHTGFAIVTLFTADSPILIWSTLDIFNGLLELALFSLLLFISVWSDERGKRYSAKKLYSLAIVLGIVLLLIYGALSEIVVPTIPLSLFQGLGIITFGVDISLLGATIYLVFQSSKKKPPYHSAAFITFCVLLSASAVPLIIPILQPSIIWTLSVVLHSVSFFILYLSLSVPYMQNFGMKPRNATFLSSGISVLFLAPFIITLAVEGLVPGFYSPDIGAYTIIHLGAASLSAVMALLTYGHAKTRKQKNLYPLILLFVSWTVVDITQVLLSQVPTPYAGESLVPYITGSIVSLFALFLAIRWTMSEPRSNLPRPEFWPILGAAIQMTLVTIAEMTQTELHGAVPGLVESPLGRSTLLVINLFAMFLFTYFIGNLSKTSGGGFTVEILLSGFLSLWIIPNILKANFLDWTAGWYSAEVLLLVALLCGPAILGMLYLREMRRTETAHQRARVYSDLLVHDISNYHQAIIISLGLLEVNGIQTSLREQIVRDAQTELHRADDLIRNVRQLGKSEEISFQNFECLDLVQCIRNSYENAIPSLHEQSIEFTINRNLGECYVQAHPLIDGIFTNLLRNAVQYSPDKKRIEVVLELGVNEEGAIWIVRVIDYGQGIEPEKKTDLFNRFMTGARGTGLGLSVAKTLAEVFGGTISVEDRVPGDFTKGTVFILTLPVAP